jgi:hypothetical protein
MNFSYFSRKPLYWRLFYFAFQFMYWALFRTVVSDECMVLSSPDERPCSPAWRSILLARACNSDLTLLAICLVIWFATTLSPIYVQITTIRMIRINQKFVCVHSSAFSFTLRHHRVVIVGRTISNGSIMWRGPVETWSRGWGNRGMQQMTLNSPCLKST